MRVPLNWLADYVDLDMPAAELAHRLTMSGLKVEAVHSVGADWHDVYVGEVIELEPHPRSKKPLWVARVRVGDGGAEAASSGDADAAAGAERGQQSGTRVVTVVTGAQNLFVGARAPIILVGGLLPHGPDGDPIVIQARPMAGITSEGMLASERELGLSDEHTGIYVLPPDVPVGAPLQTVLGGDVLEIETNPNRPDTLSIIGIAREVAAVTGQQLTLPDLEAVTGAVEWVDEPSIEVQVEDHSLCPRYSALRVDGLSDASSPFWMASRLRAAGMRPINLLVDITNYVMLEYGQPMHAFDASLLKGGRIVVRRASDGEHLRTLDGADRVLSPEDLVIADGERAVALAGVMGGEESEISGTTHSIVLESANFNPVSVRRTAKRLNLRTEASARFEKGLPPEQTVLGLQRYLQLLAQVSDGPLRVYRTSDAWVGPPPERTVSMPMRDLDRLLGIRVPAEQAAESLSLLGFDARIHDSAISVTVPFWRRADISLSADLVEEVGRMIGFDSIPATLPNHTLPPPEPLRDMALEGKVRRLLLADGASELVTHALTSPDAMARLLPPPNDAGNGHGPEGDGQARWAPLVVNAAGVYARNAETCPMPLFNPPTRDRTVLPLTLVPSLLDEASRNLKHVEERVAFFEIARTFFPRPADLPYERRTLGLALSGRRQPRSWASPEPGPYSFYDVKGMLEVVLAGLRIEGWTVRAAAHPALHPGRSAVLDVGGRDVAYFGELRPEVAARFEIETWPMQVAEVDLDTLFSTQSEPRVFRPLPRHPAARRDIAVVVDVSVPAADLLRVVRRAGSEVLESADIFDVYAGEPLPDGAKSVAIAMDLRAPGATLTHDQIDTIMQEIVGALNRDLGATLRE